MTKATPFAGLIGVVASIAGSIGTQTRLSVAMGVLFWTFVLGICALSIALPGYAYDMVPYIGAALQANGELLTVVHQDAWAAAKTLAPPEVYNDLANADAYRERQSTDPDAFWSILPLYSVKIGYTALLSLAGDSLSMAKLSLAASVVSALALGLVALFWMWSNQSLHAVPITIAVMLLGNYFDLARYSGPDIIASAAILFGLFLWMRKLSWLAMALFLFAFLFRPDTIVLLIALIIAGFLFKQEILVPSITFVVALVLSLIIQRSMGHPGWWAHYYFSNVTIQPTLVGFAPEFSMLDWVKGMARGVFASITQFNWPALLLAGLFAMAALVKRGYPISNRQSALVAAMILTIGGKFALFPLPDDRLYMVFLLAMTLGILGVWKPDLSWRKNASA